MATPLTSIQRGQLINPFADYEDGRESNTTVGFRLEKVQWFDIDRCNKALDLHKQYAYGVDGGIWLQKKVHHAILARLKHLEKGGQY